MKSESENFYPTALTIAGSDSGGGAGIQADLRTFSAIGVYGCSAITAVTSQNPRAVSRVDVLAPEAVEAQLNAVFDCFAVKAAKTGMLANAGIIRAIARVWQARKISIPLIVDPVMVATSGARLLDEDAVAVLKSDLLPLASWITPNIPEAELLLGQRLKSQSDFIAGAQAIARQWKTSCLLKVGHALAGMDEAADVVAHEGKTYLLSAPVVEDCQATHGTGCTLSAALAALFAGDTPWKTTLREAKGFVYGSLLECAPVGPGCEAMYPPLENYAALVQLENLEPGKAARR